MENLILPRSQKHKWPGPVRRNTRAYATQGRGPRGARGPVRATTARDGEDPRAPVILRKRPRPTR